MKIICPKCGFEDEGNFCSRCGEPLIQTEITKKESQIPLETFWTEKCPVCKSGILKEITQKKLWGLINSTNFTCNKCDSVFVTDGNKYRLTYVASNFLPVGQEYIKQNLTKEEWKRISYGGFSDDEQRIIDDEQRKTDIEQYMTDLREGKVSVKFRIEGGSSSVILKDKEELLIMLPNIALREARSVRDTSGGYAGPSFRIAKGVSFRVGAFGAQSESHDELKQVDRGTLTLTNKRLIFTGEKRSSEINLSKIISIEPYSDGIALKTSGRSKVQYFVGIDLNQISTTVTINERSYSEPFTGLMLKYIIEGIIKREGTKG
jgi:hypothetical protein